MAYEVPPLPYDYDALEPHIDKATMEFHHDKHHQAYVDKVNAALEGTDWADKPIEDVVANLSQIPDDKRTAVRNNGGGHWNHSMFWKLMGPNAGGDPTALHALDRAVDRDHTQHAATVRPPAAPPTRRDSFVAKTRRNRHEARRRVRARAAP